MLNFSKSRFRAAPLHMQLADKLKIIIHQQLKPGENLPPDSLLADRFKVSPGVVSRAIDLLINQGIVLPRHEKDITVAPQSDSYPLHQMMSFSEDMHRRGLTPGSKILCFETRLPSEAVASELQIHADNLVYYIKRLRLANDEPMAISTAYMPCSFFPNLTIEIVENGSLYDFIMTSMPLRLTYANRTMRSVSANAEQAELLKVSKESPLMQVEGTSFAENNQPVEHVCTFYRGDRYQYGYHAIR